MYYLMVFSAATQMIVLLCMEPVWDLKEVVGT